MRRQTGAATKAKGNAEQFAQPKVGRDVEHAEARTSTPELGSARESHAQRLCAKGLDRQIGRRERWSHNRVPPHSATRTVLDPARTDATFLAVSHIRESIVRIRCREPSKRSPRSKTDWLGNVEALWRHPSFRRTKQAGTMMPLPAALRGTNDSTRRREVRRVLVSGGSLWPVSCCPPCRSPMWRRQPGHQRCRSRCR